MEACTNSKLASSRLVSKTNEKHVYERASQ